MSEVTRILQSVSSGSAAAARSQWKTQEHFYAVAAEVMRRILVDRARRRRSGKHGGELERVELTLPAANLELSWPSTAGFNLQRSDTLTSTSTWAAASAVTTRLANGISYVTVTNAVPNRFFRLHRP